MPIVRRRTDACARVAVLAVAAALSACSFTVTPPPSASRPLVAPALAGPALDQYQMAIADRVIERNPSSVLHGTPQAMLRSLVVVAFTVDRNGRLVRSAIYRSNGDSEAEEIALASLRRASPLPAPPARLLDGRGEIEIMESWLFNDNGKFQLRNKASQQAQTIE